MSRFLPQELIRAKRDGARLDKAAIEAFVAGVTDGSVTDAQIAAFAMAVFFRGMEPEEGASLTLAMRSSGDVIDWKKHGFDAGAPIVDKHSTGGVGDKVSLLLAPIVAAAGGIVPMIAGRGLGHTGGTIDKLEGIPGYDVTPANDLFVKTVKDIGCSIIGQTANLAPADKRIYAVRDVTATVESVPLITASILSKKLAAGLHSLVMDVKVGNGAFMTSVEDARTLASSIVRVARAAGMPTTALLTDMNECLGFTAGNNVEVRESVAALTDPANADLRLIEITLSLAAEMLVLTKLAKNRVQGEEMAEEALHSGKAAERFGQMVAAHGGPADILEAPDLVLPVGPVVRDVPAPVAGRVSKIDTRGLGLAVIALGGGRTDPKVAIDHKVGFSHMIGTSVKLEAGDPLARVYAADADAADAAIRAVQKAYTITDEAYSIRPLVLETITE
ncbi:thymidine phosphorylase [Pseudokordiimonas caeni]|uniref:thymidine phosphorylase n=1 Tax=Pseudokordiimonas caeni TaxID=2997908 RepID=UPI002811C781|nr:thymidine phosphorylase [Pseudokordiimonas caeni]